MGPVVPTKELLDMIEERIPYGRFLTTAALLLCLLALIVGSSAYLYHGFVLPVVNFTIAGVTTGKINLGAFKNFLGSVATTAVILVLFERIFRGTKRIMDELIQHSGEVIDISRDVIASAIEAETQVKVLAEMMTGLKDRVELLERRL